MSKHVGYKKCMSYVQSLLNAHLQGCIIFKCSHGRMLVCLVTCFSSFSSYQGRLDFNLDHTLLLVSYNMLEWLAGSYVQTISNIVNSLQR